jgi:hypothetical protein
MRSAVVWLVPIICAAVLWPAPAPPLSAQTRDPVALSGQVTSAEEGPMEGVLVSARKYASTVTTTVVSDPEGRYRFSRIRPSPASARQHPRAGYDLDALTATVARQKTRDARSEAAETRAPRS